MKSVATAAILVFFSVASAMGASSIQSTPAKGNCSVSLQSKILPYSLTVACNPDCNHMPEPLSVPRLIVAGVDSIAAPTVANLQLAFWHRACDRKK